MVISRLADDMDSITISWHPQLPVHQPRSRLADNPTANHLITPHHRHKPYSSTQDTFSTTQANSQQQQGRQPIITKPGHASASRDAAPEPAARRWWRSQHNGHGSTQTVQANSTSGLVDVNEAWRCRQPGLGRGGGPVTRSDAQVLRCRGRGRGGLGEGRRWLGRRAPRSPSPDPGRRRRRFSRPPDAGARPAGESSSPDLAAAAGDRPRRLAIRQSLQRAGSSSASLRPPRWTGCRRLSRIARRGCAARARDPPRQGGDWSTTSPSGPGTANLADFTSPRRSMDVLAAAGRGTAPAVARWRCEHLQCVLSPTHCPA